MFNSPEGKRLHSKYAVIQYLRKRGNDTSFVKMLNFSKRWSISENENTKSNDKHEPDSQITVENEENIADKIDGRNNDSTTPETDECLGETTVDVEKSLGNKNFGKL